ncbi:hypothetical protein OJAV_G00110820 [Oryzias javanicus]|uniref:Nectin cell adhesion molecule 3 n=1 Tax=Oryzias javanicus TaxID=123683 RepID=A0A3S2P820_ORYJA|nr:hypothetical protein OJAV_G00110820 [Oryzias javanicus]
MSDAGRFTCGFTTYPTGKEQGTTTLIMLAKPKNSADILTVLAGTKSVVVAQCVAADSKPAASINWISSVRGNYSTSTTSGPDGTVTVRSEYRLVPTRDDNDKEVTCVVDQRTQERQWTKTLRLSVEYPPLVSIVGYDHKWYVGRLNAELVCQVKANPPPTSITWKFIPFGAVELGDGRVHPVQVTSQLPSSWRWSDHMNSLNPWEDDWRADTELLQRGASGPLPDSVVVDNNRLTVRKVDAAVNTTFVCEVKNKHGTSNHSIEVFVNEASEDLCCNFVVARAKIISLLALLLVVALVQVLLTCRRWEQRRGYPNNRGSTSIISTGSNTGHGNEAPLPSISSGNSRASTSNRPMYISQEGIDAAGMPTGILNNYHPYYPHHFSPGNPPPSYDMFFQAEIEQVVWRKRFLDDSLDEEEEQYCQFGEGGNVQLAVCHTQREHQEEMDVYLDDEMEAERNNEMESLGDGDMESLRDGDMESLGDGDMESLRDGDMESLRDGDMESLRDGDMESLGDEDMESLRDGDMESLGGGSGSSWVASYV